MRHRILHGITILLLAACGGDDPTAPFVANVAGSWRFETEDVTGEGFTCAQTGSTLTLTQSGTSISGTLSGGTVACESAQGTTTQDFGTANVSGTVDSYEVSLTLTDADPGTTMTGSFATAASAMSGTITEKIYLEDGSVGTLTGSWVAVKR